MQVEMPFKEAPSHLRLAYCVRQVAPVRPSWIVDATGFGVLAGSCGWLVARSLGAGTAGDLVAVVTFLAVYVVGISALRGRSYRWRLVRGPWS